MMDMKLEDTNVSRIENLLRNVAQPAVKVKFDQEIDPRMLQQTLNRQKLKVLEPLRKKNIIFGKQWNLLFPIPNQGNACSTTFDLSLMICLLRNITSIPITDELPFYSNKSEGADLSRLKYYRNMISHWPNIGPKLTNEKFETYWTDISQAIVRLGGAHFQSKCLSLKVGGSSVSFPTGVKRLHEELIAEWRKEKSMS
ncbi:unnamed protein product [Mytilus edulis]|uniref:DZIP3-like HEPN domain-containing protein n=1 Tax=Mytilus edulis TaxID=6550 RepID=A0A8S3Q080_MYTED|nr:unnamed protein product [Mytilus edulis]